MGSCPGIYNTCLFAGSTFTLAFTITNLDVPVSLAGATISGAIYTDTDDASAAAVFSCSVVSGPDGQGQAVLSAATTAALTYDANPEGERNPTTFLYNIQILLSGGTTLAPLAGVILGYPRGPQTV